MASAAVDAAPSAIEQTAPPPALSQGSASTESAQQAQPQQNGVADSQLHRLCAEGDVMGVRAILSRSLELLESIDPNTGLTPMLQAIYASQSDVVRELLAAGARAPPPSVTQDPAIIALLFPGPGPSFPLGSPPAHFQSFPVGMQQPPNGAGQPEQGAYYPPMPPQGFMPMGGQEGHHGPAFIPYGAPHRRRDGKDGNGVLPPAEQAKQIPCRNFPNCRFGAACHFLHPPAAFFPQQGYVPFDPRFMAPGARPDGFYMTPPPPAFQPASPSGANGELTTSGSMSSSGTFSANAASFVPPSQPSPQPTDSSNGSSVPVASAPAFVPGQPAPSEAEHADGEPASGSQDAPEQASEQAVATASAPAAFANGGRPPFAFQNGNGLPHANGFDRKPGMHGKKASMSRMGGMANRQLLGSWSHGQPPPCVFFLANKCRNGDMCKFPHVLPDGTDCRHPDVINGSIPANPVSLIPRPPKGRNGMNGGFAYGAPAHAQRGQGAQAGRAAAPAVNGEAAAHKTGETTDATTEKKEDSPDVTADNSKVSSPSADGARPTTTRSVPNTRAHSPTHGAGPFGGARAGRFGRGGSQSVAPSARSASIPPAQAKVPKQRVPGAEEFPALSGSTASLTSETSKPVQMIGNGKTAAQVLSEPAPAPPAPVASEASPSKPEGEALVRTFSGSSSVRGVETQSDDDAVLISQLPADHSPSKPSSSRPGVRAGISFASITSSATSVPETPQVALQA